MDYLTTKQFAKEVGLTYGRVCQLIWEKRIKASKMGRDWIIPKKELDRWKSQNTVGNPETINEKH